MAHDSGMTTVEVADKSQPAAPQSPPRRWPRWPRRADGRPPLIVEVAVMAWLFWLYDVINNLAPTRSALALGNARSVLDLEQSLGIDVELSLNRWLSAHAVLAFIATYYYFFAHVAVTLVVLGWLWWKRPWLYSQARTQLVLINLIAFAVFWRYPLAPPRMLPALGYQDVVSQSHGVFSWHSGALRQDADQFAAMPSLHVAWASWAALAVWRGARRPWVRALALLHPLLTSVVVLVTGNHWLLDVLAGEATFLVGVALQRLLWLALPGRRLERHRRLSLPEIGERGAQGVGVASGSRMS
jgi:hypothetical protein